MQSSTTVSGDGEGEPRMKDPSFIDPERLDALAAAFSVLARLHQEPPDAELLATLPSLRVDWPLPDTSATAAGLEQLRASGEAHECASAIRSDHARLYGHVAVAKVSPYESVHRGRDGLVFDEETLQVRDAYRSLSLQAPRLNREPDDHIGLELDFIAQSCAKARDALDAGSRSDAERYMAVGTRFFVEHLLQWAPTMLAKAAELADTRFMKGICHLTLGALDEYGRAEARATTT